MSELSPAARAARAVLDSIEKDKTIYGMPLLRPLIAAALRAVAARNEAVEIRTAPGTFEFDQVIRVSDLLAIADELEAQ